MKLCNASMKTNRRSATTYFTLHQHYYFQGKDTNHFSFSTHKWGVSGSRLNGDVSMMESTQFKLHTKITLNGLIRLLCIFRPITDSCWAKICFRSLIFSFLFYRSEQEEQCAMHNRTTNIIY